jgi:hypothetical protein
MGIIGLNGITKSLLLYNILILKYCIILAACTGNE